MNDNLHTHVSVAAPTVGSIYRLTFNGTPVYDGTILRTEGCWARVRIERPLDGKHKELYKIGDEYEIKWGMYGFEELV